MARAVAIYQAELAKEPTEDKKGRRTVCREVEKEYLVETGRVIKLNDSTLANLAKGGRRLSDFNAEKGWLTPEETERVIEYSVETARRGFPLSHKRLKEHVNEILHTRLGDKFPETGVGKNWTDRFIEKHSNRLGTYYARGLDSARGRAVNPATKNAYFSLLHDTLSTGDNGKPIEPHCIWAFDESGFQGADEGKERVIGASGVHTVYEQQSGSKELTTVIVSICADGETAPPCVIFKGKGYRTNWCQENPANAS